MALRIIKINWINELEKMMKAVAVHIEMMANKMSQKKMSDKLCKFQNSGYCKYKENCKFKHVTEICENKCDRKTCMKRHQKLCKFESRCRR